MPDTKLKARTGCASFKIARYNVRFLPQHNALWYRLTTNITVPDTGPLKPWAMSTFMTIAHELIVTNYFKLRGHDKQKQIIRNYKTHESRVGDSRPEEKPNVSPRYIGGLFCFLSVKTNNKIANFDLALSGFANRTCRHYRPQLSP